MKKYYYPLIAAAVFGMASCADDAIVGGGDAAANLAAANGDEVPILFGGSSNATSRASHYGVDAANLLNKWFVVEGVKSDGTNLNLVFDNYFVKWVNDSAGTTLTNTANWEYVQADLKNHKPAAAPPVFQYVKYWDYSASSYNFAAFSYGKAAQASEGEVASKTNKKVQTPTEITLTGTAWKGAADGDYAYQLIGHPEALKQCYISDMYTAYKNYAGLAAAAQKPGYNGPYKDEEVTLRFRSLAAKIRVGFYETVPGYSVKDLKFYKADGTKIDKVNLFNKETAFKGFAVDAVGNMQVYFPMGGAGNETEESYNKASVKFKAKDDTELTKDLEVGPFDDDFSDPTYPNCFVHREYLEDADNLGKYIGRSSMTATIANDENDDNGYITVLPTGEPARLELMVDYTLVSLDGSGETIKVTGANAYVPAYYADWQPNYAYTYLFKISDNTNGTTGTTGDPEGLYPITFDAVVIETEDGVQETITTVATPSITTYEFGKVVTVKDEYEAGDIYVTVHNGTGYEDLSANSTLETGKVKGRLYKFTDTAATEDEIRQQIQFGKNSTGWNRVLVDGLEEVSGSLDLTATEIPRADGTTINVTAGQVAKITAAGSTKYAFVYELGEIDPYSVYSAVVFPANSAQPADWGSDYYKYDENGQLVVAGTWVIPADPVTYYKKYETVKDTNTPPKSRDYAVKIIKVQ